MGLSLFRFRSFKGRGPTLLGTLNAPGADPGDVLTVGADGYIAPESAGGGSQPFNGGTITGQLVIAPTDIEAVPLSVLAPSGQDNDIVEVKAGTDFILSISSDGSYTQLEGAQGAVSTELHLEPPPGKTGFCDLDTRDGLYLGSSDDGAGGSMVRLDARASHTGYAIEYGHSQSGTGFKVLNHGAILTSDHAAPGDDDLVAGDMAIWFDQTNGAAKLMVKAKTANGTIVTGSLALA